MTTRYTKFFLSRVTVLACLLFLIGAQIALSAAPTVKQQPLKYSKVRVFINSNDDLAKLSGLGLAVDHITYRGTYFETAFNNREIEKLKHTGLKYEILVDDLEAEYAARPKLTPAEKKALLDQQRKQYNAPEGFHFGSMDGYYKYAEMMADLDDMRTQYPNLITAKVSLGQSIQGRDLWMVKISDNPDSDEPETEVLYTGVHHAREPESMALLMYFMWYLLENYGTDPTVTNLVNTRELYFVPIVNPDGYVKNETDFPNGGGMWRKNLHDNGGSPDCDGVDLNRNYGQQWGYDDSGSSPFTCDETYRGTAAFSEPETQIMRTFADAHQFVTTFNYHTYGNYEIFPWGYHCNSQDDTPDQATFVSFAQQFVSFNGYTYGHACQTVGYPVNGEANDWYYGEQVEKPKVFSFTPEVGDWFWPGMSQIIPLAVENVGPNLVLAQAGQTCPAITVSPATLPDGDAGVPYNQTVSASGGTAPYTYEVNNGALPDGLTLDSATGAISGTPTVAASFTFTITATDNDGCTGSQVYTVTINGNSLCDQFNDDVLDPNWSYIKQTWTETGGYLNGTPSARKAIAIATPAFANCQNCNVQTSINMSGGTDTRVWVLINYTGKTNTMELLFKEASDKVILKQRVNGNIVKKAKASITLDQNVDYQVQSVFDGTQFVISINGTAVINFTPVGAPASGSVGFQTKNGTGAFNYLCVQ